MRDITKYKFQIRAGTNVVSEHGTVIETANALKCLCPTLTSRYLYNYVRYQVNPSLSKIEDVDYSKKIGQRFRVVLVRKNNPIKEMNELDLVLAYKSETNLKRKDQIFSEIVRRYENFLTKEAHRIFNHVDVEYFSMDLDDCKSEAYYCLKLALNYFSLDKVSDNFNEELFSISYYVKEQVRARISSYYYKRYKKQKRNIQYESYNFQGTNEDETNYSYLLRSDENVEENTINKVLLDRLESRLCPIQKKIKDLLMEGMKESKIRTILRLSLDRYECYKNALRRNMVEVGFN